MSKMTKTQTEKLLAAIRNDIRLALQPPSRGVDWFTTHLRRIDDRCEAAQLEIRDDIREARK